MGEHLVCYGACLESLMYIRYARLGEIRFIRGEDVILRPVMVKF